MPTYASCTEVSQGLGEFLPWYLLLIGLEDKVIRHKACKNDWFLNEQFSVKKLNNVLISSHLSLFTY